MFQFHSTTFDQVHVARYCRSWYPELAPPLPISSESGNESALHIPMPRANLLRAFADNLAYTSNVKAPLSFRWVSVCASLTRFVGLLLALKAAD